MVAQLAEGGDCYEGDDQMMMIIAWNITKQ